MVANGIEVKHVTNDNLSWLQWFLIGYSLTFSAGGSAFIGNFDHLFLFGVHPAPVAPHLPGQLFVLYQAMFAAITPALIFGAAAERFELLFLQYFCY